MSQKILANKGKSALLYMLRTQGNTKSQLLWWVGNTRTEECREVFWYKDAAESLALGFKETAKKQVRYNI